MKVQRCKGTRDLSPEEMKRFRFIDGVFRDACVKNGYGEVKTPTLEYLHLFTSVGTLTPSMLSKVYSFLDWDGWSGERVVLRPDGTIPVARLYIESMEEARRLAKLFYITNVFIFEETGKKTRERWQCGAELIGVSSAMADVELITLALGVLERLGLKDIELKLSHAGLIKKLLTKLGLTSEEQALIFDRLMDGETEALTKVKLVKPELGEVLSLLLDMKGESSGFLKNLKALLNDSLPELAADMDNFIGITALLESLGYNFQIDIPSGRGLEYYTGLIFQLFKDGEKIGGGGRYDALISLVGGKNAPASGFALYLDHLMKLIPFETSNQTSARRILVQMKSQATGTATLGFKAAAIFQEAGYTAELNLSGRKPASSEWVLDVQSKSPQFALTSPVKHRRFEAQTPEEILALLGR